MNQNKIFVIIITFLCTLHFSSHAHDILKTKKWELELNMLSVPVYIFNYPSLQNGFYFENIEIGLFSEYKNRIRFVLDLDFSELSGEDGSRPYSFIENVYLQYNFYKLLKVRLGQYKVPLGEEITLGTVERPSLYHSFGSKNLAPGRSQGIMMFGNDLFSIIGYRIGVFNAFDASEPENETPYLSTAGKLFFEFDNIPSIYLKIGYSIYYSFDEIFAQSAFSFFTWQINNDHKFTLFSEYLENRFYNYYWNNSSYLLLSYRYKGFEIYSAGELYDENSGKMDKDDCFSLCSGINVYWLKDHLRAGLGHRYVNEYQTGDEKNEFTLMLMWEQ